MSETDVAGPIASAPLGATLPGFVERKPSGIPAATAASGRGALVSSSLPSRLTLGGVQGTTLRSAGICTLLRQGRSALCSTQSN